VFILLKPYGFSRAYGYVLREQSLSVEIIAVHGLAAVYTSMIRP
jgi:hypothetical protein